MGILPLRAPKRVVPVAQPALSKEAAERADGPFPRPRQMP